MRRPAAVATLPEEPGVYRFRGENGRVLYLGRALNLRRRVASYWGGLGDRRHLARMVATVARIEAIVCASEHEAAWAERNLLERSLPRWNRTKGGQESPVYLLLDTSTSAPGLTLAHEPGTRADLRLFGPYLGGNKLRLAVSGLHRVFPLHYAGTRLSGAGREMGRVRQVGVDNRAELAAAIVAVLERDPAAATALGDELARRRDEAARVEAFELAGKLHEEIAAIAWLVGVQRATTMAAPDVAFSGWSDGIALRFDVRAGRLSGWRQMPCAKAGSGASGPPEWAEFARRNAALAAVLARHPVR
jgi:excinuclease ABC subunit C